MSAEVRIDQRDDELFKFTEWGTGILQDFASTVEMNRDTSVIPRQRNVYGRMAIHANWEPERRKIDYEKFMGVASQAMASVE